MRSVDIQEFRQGTLGAHFQIALQYSCVQVHRALPHGNNKEQHTLTQGRAQTFGGAIAPT